MFLSPDNSSRLSNASHKSQHMHQLQESSEVSLLHTLPALLQKQRLFFLTWLGLIDPPPTTFTPSSDENWFVLFGFSLHFSPQRFFTAVSAVYFLPLCVPAMKEKATQLGPRQQTEVDTDVIETGYWYSSCWLPAYLGRELLLSCTRSGRLSFHSGRSVHSCFLSESLKTAGVPCHVCFWSPLSSVMTASLNICQSDILMQSQAPGLTFEAWTILLLLKISIQPVRGLHFPAFVSFSQMGNVSVLGEQWRGVCGLI